MNTRIFLAFLISACCTAESLQAQAFCALRDPVEQINGLFPSTTYASLVGTVTKSTREAVSEQLPFTLHFNELGQHTLYAVNGEDGHVGYVHVRPELGKWGLTEIAWAIDKELRIVDFSFQRCRNRRRTILEQDAFKSQIIGKNINELRALINEQGTAINVDNLKVDAIDREFALIVVKCAMKTLVVTSAVWEEEVKSAASSSDSSNLDSLNRSEVTEIYTPSVNELLEKNALKDAVDIDRKTVRLFF